MAISLCNLHHLLFGYDDDNATDAEKCPHFYYLDLRQDEVSESFQSLRTKLNAVSEAYRTRKSIELKREMQRIKIKIIKLKQQEETKKKETPPSQQVSDLEEREGDDVKGDDVMPLSDTVENEPIAEMETSQNVALEKQPCEEEKVVLAEELKKKIMLTRKELKHEMSNLLPGQSTETIDVLRGKLKQLRTCLDRALEEDVPANESDKESSRSDTNREQEIVPPGGNFMENRIHSPSGMKTAEPSSGLHESQACASGMLEGSPDFKRKEYQTCVKRYWDMSWDVHHQKLKEQISLEMRKSLPVSPLLSQKILLCIMERITFVWSLQHQEVLFFSGVLNVVAPICMAFMSKAVPQGSELQTWDVATLPTEKLDVIEADAFWHLSKFLEGLEDNYTFGQRGIQQKVKKLKEVIQKIDGELHSHLQENEVDFMHFSFSWMESFLMKELPMHCTIRLWDTYMAECDGFAEFHVYVCAAFLLRWRSQLLHEKDFQGLMRMLQNLPTKEWCTDEISELVAEAYRLQQAFPNF